MRWVLDAIAVLTLAGLIVGVVLFQKEQRRDEAVIQRVIADLQRLELEVKYRAVTKAAILNELGWPATIDPGWFADDPPRNRLVTAKRPWVEVAPERDADLMHPRIRMAVDDELAAYWYNPYKGILRARVPVMVSDIEAVTLYNRVNSAALVSIFDTEPTPGERALELLLPKPQPAQVDAPQQEEPPVDLDPTRPASGADSAGATPVLDPEKAAKAFSKRHLRPSPAGSTTQAPTKDD